MSGRPQTTQSDKENEPSQSSPLQLFAPVQRVSELQQPAVILSDLVGQMPGGVDLTQSELVVVLVVEDVEEGRKERVEVVEDGELLKNGRQLLVDRILSELDLSHVELKRKAGVRVRGEAGRQGEWQESLTFLIRLIWMGGKQEKSQSKRAGRERQGRKRNEP